MITWRDFQIKQAKMYRDKGIKNKNWRAGFWYRNFICQHEWFAEDIYELVEDENRGVDDIEDAVIEIEMPLLQEYNVRGVDSIRIKCRGCGKRKYLARSIYKMLLKTKPHKPGDKEVL